MTHHPSPQNVVQAQLDAYGGRDLEAFLGIFAESVEVFERGRVHFASP